ncbi:M20 family metallopeptidase [Marinimicrococcus flavescens]|uniref:M20 family metallopeptidase n=1 Tax=Marinimicrococcus flavescens TaxID=3031815 RepID=A0AAP3XT27_9PROT|nr:M20 family metallopeptidase [Marinimicrococcus flavescens]
MTRSAAIASAQAFLDEGRFEEVLARRVAFRTESQNPERAAELRRYLEEDMLPAMAALGAEARVFDNPDPAGGPFLVARRIEDPTLPTVLTYGHGDTVRGMEGRWAEGRDPWTLQRDGERLYGRGTADNKGQHTINLAALEAVLATRGRLGFNLTVLIETSEETGSPGLRIFCEQQRELLAADLLVASDGPRLEIGLPTIYCGNRGGMPLRLKVSCREGAHHSGNWGGLLTNPAVVLAHALASITDARGRILIPEWRPTSLTPAVREALKDLPVGGPGAPEIDPEWGEPGLTPAEQLFGWNTLEILTLHAGTPEAPQNAIPGTAEAVCQLRFVVGTDIDDIAPALRRHLDAKGFSMVEIVQARANVFGASRTEPDHPDIRLACASVEETTAKKPGLLPNTGGSLPGDIFAEVLDLPMVWVPHSYGGCSQHAPDEHMLVPVVREGLAIMAGLFWDLGEKPRG